MVTYFFRIVSLVKVGPKLGNLLSGTSVGTGVAVLWFYGLSAIGLNLFWRILISVGCLLGIQFATAVIKYRTFQFRIDSSEISTKFGFGNRTTLDHDWFNVRSLLLTQSYLQRQFRLASVKLATAGGSDGTIEIPCVPIALAQEWERRFIEEDFQTHDKPNNVHDEDSARSKEHKVLYELNLQDLLRGTFANGNIFSDTLGGCVFLVIVYGLYRVIYSLLFLSPRFENPFKQEGLSHLGEDVLVWVTDLQKVLVSDATLLFESFQQFTGISLNQLSLGKPLFFASLILVVAILSYLINRCFFCAKNYDLVVSKRRSHLQKQCGLLIEQRLTLRLDRVQTTSFQSTFIERSLNRGVVKIVSGNKEDALNCEIPFISPNSADGILHTVREESTAPLTFSPIGQSFTPIHVLGLIHSILFKVVIPSFLILILAAIVVPISLGILCLYAMPLIGYAFVSTFVRWKKQGYILNDEYLLFRGGGLGSYSVKVAPLTKIQRVSLKQSWIQRMRIRANIKFHFATGKESIPYLALRVAEAMKKTVADKMYGASEPISTSEELLEPDQVLSKKDWQQLPSRYVVQRTVEKLLSSVFVLAPLLFAGVAGWLHLNLSIPRESLIFPVGLLWVAITLWRGVSIFLKNLMYRYRISEHDVAITESVISKQTQTIRYSRLQSVSTHNGFIDRLFGISNLKLTTVEDEITIHGLNSQDAFRFREFIATRLKEISSRGNDVLSMAEIGSDLVDSKSKEFLSEKVSVPFDSISENNTILWQRLVGWWRELSLVVLGTLIILPFLALLAMIFVEGLLFLLNPVLPEIVSSFYTNHQLYFAILFWIIFLLLVCTQAVNIPFKSFALSDDFLRHKEGVLGRTHRVVPRNRIQNVSVSSSLLDRLFGVSSLRVTTPADSDIPVFFSRKSNSISLKYMSPETAKNLRQRLQNE